MLRPVQIGVKDNTLHHAARRGRSILTQFLQRKHSTARGLRASCEGSVHSHIPRLQHPHRQRN
jgi:hypothetical protein